MSTRDEFLHLFCCGRPYAMCGYYGPDEGPLAERRWPPCPTCWALCDVPCPDPGCPLRTEGPA